MAGKSNGPLTNEAHERTAAVEQTASIKDYFPQGVSQPALRALGRAEYTAAREKDLRALHGIGPKALAILKYPLEGGGKSFRP